MLRLKDNAKGGGGSSGMGEHEDHLLAERMTQHTAVSQGAPGVLLGNTRGHFFYQQMRGTDEQSSLHPRELANESKISVGGTGSFPPNANGSHLKSVYHMRVSHHSNLSTAAHQQSSSAAGGGGKKRRGATAGHTAAGAKGRGGAGSTRRPESPLTAKRKHLQSAVAAP